MVVFKLNNIEVPSGPIEWQDLEVLSSFNDEEINSVVEIDDATFSGDEAKIIEDWVNSGLNGNRGIYQGMPFSMALRDASDSANVFEGYLNFKESYTRLHEGKILTKINAKDDLLTLTEKLQSINFGLLYDQGIITNGDFIKEPYIVEKFDARLEFMMLAFATFMTLKETIEGVRRVGQQVTNIVKAATPNAGFPSVDLGDIITAVTLAIIDIVYVGFMISYLINLVRDLIDFIYPPIRNHIGMPIITMLTKAAEKLGLGFETGISDLNDITYIPSRPDEDDDRSGIPRPEDRGYNCDEIYNIVEDMFSAKKTIVDGKIALYAENDDFWIKNSDYTMVDVLHEPVQYNTNELVGNKLLTFETDASDGWSSVDYKGTSYAINTVSKNDSGNELIDGFNRVDFGVGIASRKNGLNDLERKIKEVAQLIDDLINTLGGNSDLAGDVQNRVGVWRVSERVHNTPRVIHHTDGKVSTRDRFSAKYLYENFHSYNSFVLDDFFGQKRIFNEVKIEFCLQDFINTSKNSYFTTHDGKIGKFTELKYRFSEDSAVASFWIREVHSTNLIEQYAEPE